MAAEAFEHQVDGAAVLRAIPLFGEVLSEPLLEGLAHKCATVVFPQSSILMGEGDFGTSMFAIVDGEVEVTVADRSGDEQGVARLAEGDVVGEMSLMTGARRSATVTAITDVVALEITKYSLEAVLARAPELIDRFGDILHRRQKERDRVAAGKADIITQIRKFFPSVFGRRDA